VRQKRSLTSHRQRHQPLPTRQHWQEFACADWPASTNESREERYLSQKRRWHEMHRLLVQLPSRTDQPIIHANTDNDNFYRTWTTMMKLHIASIPLFPRTSKKSWPMGSGKVLVNKLVTEAVAKEHAMKRSQPNTCVPNTPTRIATGAVRWAPATSSEMCAAESSGVLWSQ